MELSELEYELPPGLIAQHPAARRDASRLLVYERATREVRNRTFDQLQDELHGELVGELHPATCATALAPWVLPEALTVNRFTVSTLPSENSSVNTPRRLPTSHWTGRSSCWSI